MGEHHQFVTSKMDEIPSKVFGRDAASQQFAGSNSCFDCNICLDFAADPVVTLCGHLYCWPCIYKWLQVKKAGCSSRSCPVCKAALSEDSLVPLYSRGAPSAKRHSSGPTVPHRPAIHLNRPRPHYGGDELLSSPLPPRFTASTAGVGEMVVAVLPWVFRNHQPIAGTTDGLYYSSPYYPASLRLRRQEIQMERWLNQTWVFLFCCALLCLLWF